MGFQFQRTCWCAHSDENVRKHGEADNCVNGRGNTKSGSLDAAFDLYQVAHGN